MKDWVGWLWIRIWESGDKIIEIGIGKHPGCVESGQFGMCQIRTRRIGPFWVTVARPTLRYLKEVPNEAS